MSRRANRSAARSDAASIVHTIPGSQHNAPDWKPKAPTAIQIEMVQGYDLLPAYSTSPHGRIPLQTLLNIYKGRYPELATMELWETGLKSPFKDRDSITVDEKLLDQVLAWDAIVDWNTLISDASITSSLAVYNRQIILIAILRWMDAKDGEYAFPPGYVHRELCMAALRVKLGLDLGEYGAMLPYQFTDDNGEFLDRQVPQKGGVAELIWFMVMEEVLLWSDETIEEGWLWLDEDLVAPR